MSSPEGRKRSAPPAAPDELSALIRQLYESGMPLLGGDAERLPTDEAVQQLLTLGVKLYVAKREADLPLTPFIAEAVTATDVSITATAMLDAVDLQVFELSLWSGWGHT